MSRTSVEAILAGRGLLLAGILGPELFGVWTLFRIGLHYLAFVGLGLLRGLELKVSRSSDTAKQIRWGKAAAGHTFLLYGVLSALAAIAWSGSSERVVNVALLGIAVGLLLDRLWSYGITYLRASGGLMRFAVLELAHATLQIIMCLVLALYWGLPGAFAGFAIANLAGIAMFAGRAPLKPIFEPRRVFQLIRIGFPVSLMGILSATLVTVDRLLVGAIVGLGALGLYAFAVSISELGVSFAAVIRTVILRDVYGKRESPHNANASRVVLEQVLSGYATLGPPLVGVFALILPPLIALFASDYHSAAPIAQVLLFAGLLQGFINVTVLGIVAEGRQGRLPLISIAAVCVNVALTITVLSIGLGLQGVAAASLLTRLMHAGAIVILLERYSSVSGLIIAITRFLAPSIWCAVAVFTISHLLPGEDTRTLMLQLLFYAVALVLLSPAILQALAPHPTCNDS